MPTLSARQKGGGGHGTDFDIGGGVIPIQEIGKRQSGTPMNGVGHGQPGDPMFTLQKSAVHGIAFGGNDTRGPIDIAPALMAHKGAKGRLDFASETFIAGTLQNSGKAAGSATQQDAESGLLVPIAFDHKQAGDTALGMSEPGVPPLRQRGGLAIAFDTTQITNKDNRSNPQPGDPCHPLAAGAHPPAVTFESRFARNGRGAPADIVPPLKAQSGETGKGDAAPLIATTMAVRRLTPLECERLQGFPDNYTQIPYNGKAPELCPDGPRYKALGNSMAEPCMAWIGSRIQLVNDRLGSPGGTAW